MEQAVQAYVTALQYNPVSEFVDPRNETHLKPIYKIFNLSCQSNSLYWRQQLFSLLFSPKRISSARSAWQTNWPASIEREVYGYPSSEGQVRPSWWFVNKMYVHLLLSYRECGVEFLISKSTGALKKKNIKEESIFVICIYLCCRICTASAVTWVICWRHSLDLKRPRYIWDPPLVLTLSHPIVIHGKK